MSVRKLPIKYNIINFYLTFESNVSHEENLCFFFYKMVLIEKQLSIYTLKDLRYFQNGIFQKQTISLFNLT